MEQDCAQKAAGVVAPRKAHAMEILTEVEMEVALIEAMMWSAPIIADASGKGNNASLDGQHYTFHGDSRTSTISSRET